MVIVFSAALLSYVMARVQTPEIVSKSTISTMLERLSVTSIWVFKVQRFFYLDTAAACDFLFQ